MGKKSRDKFGSKAVLNEKEKLELYHFAMPEDMFDTFVLVKNCFYGGCAGYIRYLIHRDMAENKEKYEAWNEKHGFGSCNGLKLTNPIEKVVMPKFVETEKKDDVKHTVEPVAGSVKQTATFVPEDNVETSYENIKIYEPRRSKPADETESKTDAEIIAMQQARLENMRKREAMLESIDELDEDNAGTDRPIKRYSSKDLHDSDIKEVGII